MTGSPSVSTLTIVKLLLFCTAMLLPPVGPLPASSARDAAHVAPFVPVVEHASSGAAAIAISPVSLPVKRTVKGRSA